MKGNWFRSLFSRFMVEAVHICECWSFIGAFLPDLFSVIPILPISVELFQAMDNWSGLLVLICPSRCMFLQSNQF